MFRTNVKTALKKENLSLEKVKTNRPPIIKLYYFELRYAAGVIPVSFLNME